MGLSYVQRGEEKWHLLLECDHPTCSRRLLLEGFNHEPTLAECLNAIHHHTYWFTVEPTKKHPDRLVLCSRHPKGERPHAK